MIVVIKNSTCIKALTISEDAHEILCNSSGIRSKRVEGEEFTELQNDDDTLTFLLDLGYKVTLHKYTNIKNVNYPALIREVFAYQIDHRKERRSRSENMPYPRFTKIIINNFLKQHKSLSNLKYQHYHTIKDDGIETVDVFEESEPEPELVKRKTASRRVVKKKVKLSANDNIIPDDTDAVSLTKAEEAEATRKVHATHARIMTEYVPESAKKKSGGRKSRGVAIQDTPSALKPKPATSRPKLNGAQSVTPAKKEAADIMQTFKESKKTSKKPPGTGRSSKGTGTILGVLDESTIVSATSSGGTSIKPGVPDEEKDITEENVILDDTNDTNDEDDETESDEDEIYKYKIHVRKEDDEEMLNAEVEDSIKGDAKVSDAAKADAEKAKEAKDDSKKAELPPASSSLSISLSFGDQFLKLSSDTSLVSTVKDIIYAEISSLLDNKIQYEVPHIQSPFVLRVPVCVISKPTVLTLVQKTSLAAPITTLPLPSVSTTPSVPQQTTTPIPIPPIITDTPIITTTILESDALSDVQLRVVKLEKICLSSRILITLLKLLLLSSPKFQCQLLSLALEILKVKREQAEKQQTPKFTIKSTDKAAHKEYDQKSALYLTMHANKSFKRNPANHKLYHALMEALIEDENAIDKGVADTVKDHKRKHDDEDNDDEDPLAGPNQGKKKKRRRTNESESSKKPPTTKETPKGKASSKGFKTSEDVVRNDDLPQDTFKPKAAKTLNLEWFTQPPSPPTLDPK
nr:hypothetical protein [Tanacetum cinerariifolium]